MLKLLTNKFGNISIDESVLKKSVEKCIAKFINIKNSVCVELEVKKNALKKVQLFFKKNFKISFDEQKGLYEQIAFLLSISYGINNSLIIFNYEN